MIRGKNPLTGEVEELDAVDAHVRTMHGTFEPLDLPASQEDAEQATLPPVAKGQTTTVEPSSASAFPTNAEPSSNGGADKVPKKK